MGPMLRSKPPSAALHTLHSVPNGVVQTDIQASLGARPIDHFTNHVCKVHLRIQISAESRRLETTPNSPAEWTRECTIISEYSV